VLAYWFAWLSVALAQEVAAEAAETAAKAAAGWEVWAAGGGAAILSGGGGAVIVRKAVALLSMESAVQANAGTLAEVREGLSAVRLAMEAERARNDAQAEAIAAQGARMDAIRTTLAERAAPSPGDQARREEFVELRADVKHLQTHCERIDAAIRGVQQLIIEAQRGH
jgi:hypothetical protein